MNVEASIWVAGCLMAILGVIKAAYSEQPLLWLAVLPSVALASTIFIFVGQGFQLRCSTRCAGGRAFYLLVILLAARFGIPEHAAGKANSQRHAAYVFEHKWRGDLRTLGGKIVLVIRITKIVKVREEEKGDHAKAQDCSGSSRFRCLNR